MSTRPLLVPVLLFVMVLVAMAVAAVFGVLPGMVLADVDTSDVKRCAVGFACGAIQPLLPGGAMTQAIGGGACLVAGSSAFQQGIQKAEEDKAKPFRQCAHEKMHKEAMHQEDAGKIRQCVHDKFAQCKTPCLNPKLPQAQRLSCLKQCSQVGSSCKPAPPHLPSDAFEKALAACGYSPPSAIVPIGETLTCMILGQSILQRWVTEEAEDEGMQASEKVVEDEVETQIGESDSEEEDLEAEAEEEAEAERQAQARAEAQAQARAEAEAQERAEEEAEAEADEEAGAAEVGAAEAGEAEAGLLPLLIPEFAAVNATISKNQRRPLRIVPTASSVKHLQDQYKEEVDQEVRRAETASLRGARVQPRLAETGVCMVLFASPMLLLLLTRMTPMPREYARPLLASSEPQAVVA